MKKINKLELYTNIIFGILILVATICFKQLNVNKYITKSIASGLFVLCGAVNLYFLFKNHKGEGIWKGIILLTGLAFAAAGDIVLIDHFVMGAVLFAIGHVFFLVYFCLLQKFHVMDFILAGLLILVALLVILLYPKFEFDGLKMVVVIYAIVISCMLAKAIGNYFNFKNTPNLITMLGAFLFFFSDLMLLFYVFAGNVEIFDYFCIYTYYPAEFMLALSILLNKTNYASRKVTGNKIPLTEK